MGRTSFVCAALAAACLSAPVHAGIINGEFSAGLDGWVTAGPVSVVGSPGSEIAVLDEDEFLLDGTNLYQNFAIEDDDAPTLAFTFLMIAEEHPTVHTFIPDAFLVSLLDPDTLNPLLATPGFADFFAVSFDEFLAEFFVDFDPALVELVDVVDMSTADPPWISGIVLLDMSSLGPGVSARLDFTLAGGFDGFHTQALVDGVSMIVCLTDAECMDGNPCTEDRCVANECTNVSIPGCVPCSGNDDCQDGNPCTADACGNDGVCENLSEPAGTPCGNDAAEGPCDNPDVCDGSGTCDPNRKPHTTECRLATGECDVAEFCTGDSAECPLDAFAVDGTECADEGNDCTSDECLSGICAHPPSTAGTPCGNSVAEGPCDNPDTCDGLGSCDPAYKPNTTECRPAANVCDIAEFCTGVAPACPADFFELDGTPCPDAEFCNGYETCQSGACADADDPCVDLAHCDEKRHICLACTGNDECDDGDSCTIDECVENECASEPDPACELQVHLDIKPGSCPNPVNVKDQGVMLVAIVGDAFFDVSLIDVNSVSLQRADGIGGTVAPLTLSGVPWANVEDVATPFDGYLCDCHTLTGDGIDDLSLKFGAQEVVTAFALWSVPNGEYVTLTLTGSLTDETVFRGSDCVRVVSRKAARLGGRQ